MEATVSSDRLFALRRLNLANALQKPRRGAPALAECPMQSLFLQCLQHGNQAVLYAVAGKDAASLQGERLPIVPLAGRQVNFPECDGQSPGQGIGCG